MKTKIRSQATPGRRHAQRGAAMLVVLGVLTIMAMLVVGNSRVLYSLDEDLRLIEKKQIKKLEASQAHTTPDKAATGTKP